MNWVEQVRQYAKDFDFGKGNIEKRFQEFFEGLEAIQARNGLLVGRSKNLGLSVALKAKNTGVSFDNAGNTVTGFNQSIAVSDGAVTGYGIALDDRLSLTLLETIELKGLKDGKGSISLQLSTPVGIPDGTLPDYVKVSLRGSIGTKSLTRGSLDIGPSLFASGEIFLGNAEAYFNDFVEPDLHSYFVERFTDQEHYGGWIDNDLVVARARAGFENALELGKSFDLEAAIYSVDYDQRQPANSLTAPGLDNKHNDRQFQLIGYSDKYQADIYKKYVTSNLGAGSDFGTDSGVVIHVTFVTENGLVLGGYRMRNNPNLLYNGNAGQYTYEFNGQFWSDEELARQFGKNLADFEDEIRRDAFGQSDKLEDVKCFGAHTTVLQSGGRTNEISSLEVGDLVSSFPSSNDSKPMLSLRRVTAIHTREAEQTYDFHGTIVTPGHVFLSGDGDFKKLVEILEEDGTVVREDGSLVRARTGCPVGSVEDQVVPVTYVDGETGETVTAAMRAGAPFAADGEEAVTVAEAMRKVGYELGADGLFVDIDGNRIAAHWPWGEPDPRALAENRAAFV